MDEGSMRITVLGGGFVGVTTAVALAERGHDVRLVETDHSKARALASGSVPFHEPGLEEAMGAQSIEVVSGLEPADLIFICVGTPAMPDGACDTSHVAAAARGVAEAAGAWKKPPVVVVKSTVPPGTARNVVLPVLSSLGRPGEGFGVASNPEFLREGSALEDARRPDRVVYGTLDPLASERMSELYAKEASPVFACSLETAEMVKYASNAFLATKISLSNEMANYAEAVGTDIDDVMDAVGADPRIGRAFLDAGCGYGGSCFPKDVAGLGRDAAARGVPSRILSAVQEVNESQPLRVVAMAKEALGDLSGKRVALLGLAFKAGTSDVRETRALPMWQALVDAGAAVVCHDPEAGQDFQRICDAQVADSLDEALQGADAAVIQTGWPEYQLPASRFIRSMKQPVVIDARRHLKDTAGLRYRAIGVPVHEEVFA